MKINRKLKIQLKFFDVQFDVSGSTDLTFLEVVRHKVNAHNVNSIQCQRDIMSMQSFFSQPKLMFPIKNNVLLEKSFSLTMCRVDILSHNLFT